MLRKLMCLMVSLSICASLLVLPRKAFAGVVSFVDEMDNFTKMHSYSKGFSFDTTQSEKMNGDTSRLRAYSATPPAELVYKMPLPIMDFYIDKYVLTSQPSSNVEYHVSKDGENYIKVETSTSAGETSDSSWGHDVVHGVVLEKDMYYLKILFTSRPNNYNPNIARVRINYVFDGENKIPTIKSSKMNYETSENIAVGDVLRAVDSDGDDVTYKIHTKPANGTVSIDSNGKWTYLPNVNFFGEDVIRFAADDSKGGVAIHKVNVKVKEINDSPVVTNTKAVTFSGHQISGSVNATDPEGDKISYSVLNKPQNGSIEVDKDGTWRYKPESDFVGQDVFEIAARDNRGASGSCKVDVTVNAENTPPEIEDAELVTMMNSLQVLNVNASDIEGDSLTYAIKKAPEHGTATIDQAGKIEFNPEKNYVGYDSVTVSVSDESGGVSEKDIRIVANNALVDDIVDFSKMESYTSGLKIDLPPNTEIYDFDTGVKMGSNKGTAFLLYKTTFDIKTVLVHSNREKSTANQVITLSVSRDGKTFSKLKPEIRQAPKMAYQSWRHDVHEVLDGIPSGMRYLKVEFSSSNGSTPCIGSVSINAEDDLAYRNTYAGYTAEDIVDMVRQKHPNGAHPRIKATKQDFDNLRNWYKTDSYVKPYADKLIAGADKILDEPVITRVIDGQGYLLETARKVLDRMTNLGMAYQLTGDKKYVDRAWLDLNSAANFAYRSQAEDGAADLYSPWKMDHYLDTAELTTAFAYAYDWMYDAWTPEQRKVISDAIIEKGLKTAVDAYSGKNAWYTFENNMNSVVNAGMIAGALAVIEEEPELCGKIVVDAMNSLDYSITQYAPEGAYREGPNYWSYGTKYVVTGLSTLESATGTDFGLSNTPGLSMTGNFPVYAEGPLGTFNYADGGVSKTTAQEIMWFADKFDQPELAWFFRNNNRTPNLLYYNPELYSNPDDAKEFDLDKSFAGPEVAFMRSAWSDDEALYVGYKAGTPQEAHGDMDMGTFVLDALGIRWAMDLGAEDYNAPGIWDWEGKAKGTRYNYYRKNPEGHNTLLINPDGDQHQDALAFSPITRTELNKEDGGYVISDLSPAYARTANGVKRGIMMYNNRHRVLVQDEIQTKKPSEIYWFMHTQADISISDDGRTAILTRGDKRLSVKLAEPVNAKFTVMSATPLPTSIKAKNAANSGVKKLTIKLEHAVNPTIAVWMTPLNAIEDIPTDAPEIVPLDEWKVSEQPTAKVSTIKVNGTEIENFDSNKNVYKVFLPPETEGIPTVTLESNYQTKIDYPTELPGIIKISVWDEAGIARPNTYFMDTAVMVKTGLPENADQIPLKLISSSGDDGNPAENLLDEDLGTRWADDSEDTNAILELETMSAVDTVSMAWYLGNERQSYYELFTSTDGVNWQPWTEGVTATSGLTADYELLEFPERTFKFLKIKGYGSTQKAFTSITEIKLFNVKD